MRITSNQSLIKTNPIDKSNEQNNIVFKPEFLEEDCAVELTISKNGRQCIGNSITVSTEKPKDESQYVNNLAWDTDMLSEFNCAYNQMRNSQTSVTEDDMVNCISKTYERLYKEIVDGYQTGTRVKYVRDDKTESGYRQLTKEEEIQWLDKAYDDMVGYAQRTSNSVEKTNKHLESLARVLDSFAIKKRRAGNSFTSGLAKKIKDSIEHWNKHKVFGGVTEALQNQRSYIKQTYFGVTHRKPEE